MLVGFVRVTERENYHMEKNWGSGLGYTQTRANETKYNACQSLYNLEIADNFIYLDVEMKKDANEVDEIKKKFNSVTEASISYCRYWKSVENTGN